MNHSLKLKHALYLVVHLGSVSVCFALFSFILTRLVKVFLPAILHPVLNEVVFIGVMVLSFGSLFSWNHVLATLWRNKKLNFSKRTEKWFLLYCLLLVPLWLWGWHLYLRPSINEEQISTFSTINYPTSANYRQTGYDCGPYSVAAVVTALSGQTVDPQNFVKEMKWRLPNGYTLPWGLGLELEQNGISIKVPDLVTLSDEDKIAFLKQELNEDRPVIILGERDSYEHYLTLFGFDSTKEEFYVYDSLYEKGEEGLTIDDNGALPGNRNLTTQELLGFWREGGVYGLYSWYALVGGGR